MDTGSMYTEWGRFLQKWNRWISARWISLITIGTEGLPGYRERKRIRLLNGICFWVMLAYAGYMIGYSAPAYRVIFWESFQAFFFYAIPIVLNYYRRPLAACHFFCIYNLLIYTFFAVAHGQHEMSEYFLMASSVTAMLFFHRFSTIFTYFLLNLACFGLCKYSFTVMQPFLFMPKGHSEAIPNMILVFVFLFLIVYYFKWENDLQERLLEIRNQTLEQEKSKSDNLLLNILPRETAEELKEYGEARARYFKMVTVMFTDFKDFSFFCQELPPESLVAEVNRYFSVFDRIMDRYGIEKIKTIGDIYMCAGGLPEENDSHPQDVMRAAVDIQKYVADQKKKNASLGKPYFELRIGVHTGSVVAGIVGKKKFAYDIWGDTVNMASRMESTGEVGKVNLSQATYELVKDSFPCTYRGKIAAKNKGIIDMYFLDPAD